MLNVKYLKLCALALLLTTVIFSPWLQNYLTSDDWPVIARNKDVSWEQSFNNLFRIKAGWYRPLHELFVKLCWEWFGVQPLGYRLLAMALYALAAANVGLIAYLLSKESPYAMLTTFLFCVFAPHAEPVLWFASTNELLVAVFASSCFIAYFFFRKTNRILFLCLASLSWSLAIMSKETASFFPFVLLAYDLLFTRKTKLQEMLFSLLPSLSLAMLGIVFVIIRMSSGSPYSVQVTPIRLISSLIFYVLIGLFALPNNYAYVASLSLWRMSFVFPGVILLTSASTFALTAWAWVRGKIYALDQKFIRIFGFAVLWGGISLLPVILIVAERTVFLASMGIVLGLAVLFVQALKFAKTQSVVLSRALFLLIGLYLAVNLLTLEYRCAWWGKASQANQVVFEQLGEYVVDDVAVDDVAVDEFVLLNLPDHLQYAYTFRNVFPEAVKVWEYDFNVIAIVDTQWESFTVEQQADQLQQFKAQPRTTVLLYDDGALTPAW